MTNADEARAELQRRERLRSRYARLELQRRSLPEFFKGAWQILEPGTPLQYNWHLDLLSEYMDALFLEQIRNLSINIAPRHLKSTLISIIAPAYYWAKYDRSAQFLCLSYISSLANGHNFQRRRLVQSDWYQEIAGGMILQYAKNRLSEFSNSDQGVMAARGFDAGVTGIGGRFIIVDDGNDPDKIESPTIRNTTDRRFRDYTTTRANDPKKTQVINIQQRTHEKDISGVIEKEFYQDYEILVLPTEAREHTVLIFPLSGRRMERSPGDLLHHERFGPLENARAKRTLGEAMYAARHGQSPSAIGGGIFKRANWTLYCSLPARIDRVFLSCDCSFKKTDDGSFVVIQVIAQRQIRNELMELEWEYFLVDQLRRRMGFVETEEAIRLMSQRYPEAWKILIEDKANGTAVMDRLSSSFGDRLVPINPGTDSKLARAQAVSPVHQAGRIYLPIKGEAKAAMQAAGAEFMTVGEWWKLYPPKSDNSDEVPVDQIWKDLIEECALFPNGETDDQVDTLDQAVLWGEKQELEEIRPVGSLAFTRKKTGRY
jgi:phage terminase large subunit-like protein